MAIRYQKHQGSTIRCPAMSVMFLLRGKASKSRGILDWSSMSQKCHQKVFSHFGNTKVVITDPSYEW